MPDIAYKINNKYYDRKYHLITKEELKKKMFTDVKNDYFLKLDKSSQGLGVHHLTIDNFDTLTSNHKTNFVIQKAIIQHSFFDDIVPGSVATIRITTINEGDNVKSKAAYLRVGRENIKSIQASSNLRVPILDKNGHLGEYALYPSWKRTKKHPDTNFIFKGQQIPFFNNALKEVEAIHKTFPHYTLIGWDISITQNGQPRIIEWNAGHTDIKFTEAAIGPTFKEYQWEKLK